MFIKIDKDDVSHDSRFGVLRHWVIGSFWRRLWCHATMKIDGDEVVGKMNAS